MSSTPTDLLVLNGPEDTVLMGYRGTPGLAGLEPVLRNDSQPASGLMRSLSWVPTDPAQHLKLRNFLLTQSPAQAMPSTSYTVSFNATGSHGGDPVMAQLHHRLDTGRIRALRVRQHARIEHVRPVVASAVSSPVPDAGRAAVAAAGIVGWTPTERVEALIRDSLPFLAADLRREIEALLTAKGLAEMAGMIIALAAVQAIPVVGEALDAALMGIVFVYAGFSGLKAIARLIVLVRKTLAAHSEAEIAALAPDAAKAIETLGSACLLALGARWKGRSPEAAGGVPAGDAAAKADTIPAIESNLGWSPYPIPTTKTFSSTVNSEPPNLSGKPSGMAFAGKVYRYEDPDRITTTFTAHPGNIAANHRYSGPGMGAVYGATSPETALAEVQHYNAEAGRVLVEKNVNLSNVLDLTDSNVRARLGINNDQITGNDYQITQQLGRDALSNGYDAILAPSARASGSNLVIFLK